MSIKNRNLIDDAEKKNQMIALLETDVAVKDQQIVCSKTDSKEKNQKIEVLENELAVKDQQIVCSETDSKEKNQKIEVLENELAEKTQENKSLENELVNKSQKSKVLENEKSSLERQNTDLYIRNWQLETKLSQADEKISNIQRDICNSTAIRQFCSTIKSDQSVYIKHEKKWKQLILEQEIRNLGLKEQTLKHNQKILIQKQKLLNQRNEKLTQQSALFSQQKVDLTQQNKILRKRDGLRLRKQASLEHSLELSRQINGLYDQRVTYLEQRLDFATQIDLTQTSQIHLTGQIINSNPTQIGSLQQEVTNLTEQKDNHSQTLEKIKIALLNMDLSNSKSLTHFFDELLNNLAVSPEEKEKVFSKALKYTNEISKVLQDLQTSEDRLRKKQEELNECQKSKKRYQVFSAVSGLANVIGLIMYGRR